MTHAVYLTIMTIMVMLVSMVVSVNRGMSACDGLFVKRKGMMPLGTGVGACPACGYLRPTVCGRVWNPPPR